MPRGIKLYYKKLYCGLEGVNNILKELGYSIDRNTYKRIKQGNCKYHDNYIDSINHTF